MTQTSRPWSGTTPGDAGAYSDLQWQTLYQYIIGLGGHYADTGVFLGSGTPPDDGLTVQEQSPTAAAVDVLPGSGLVRGVAYISTATEALTINANVSGNPRIDTVVLEADFALQTVRLAIEEGTAAASPVPPTLTQVDSVLWQVPVADIAVANGFTVITNADITPRRLPINGGSGLYHDNILNNSGAVLETGDVVIWDSSADRAITTTTTLNDVRVAGVWVGRTANGSYGRVLKNGIGFVDAASAVTRGDLLATATSATKASVSTISRRPFARALETTSGAGLVLCAINANDVLPIDFLLYQDSKASGAAAASIASGAWRTRELTSEVIDTGGYGSLGSNQITLQPGYYAVYATAPQAANAAGRIRLQNITGGATIVQGSNGGGSSGGTPGNPLVLFGSFSLTTASALELQHYAAGTANGGIALSSGENEIYAVVFLVRLGN